MTALQTQSKGWPSSAFHICSFVLPPAPSYAIKSRQKFSKKAIEQLQCQIQLQFTEINTDGHQRNLTDLNCLEMIEIIPTSGKMALKLKAESSQMVLKLAVKSYASMNLIDLVRDFQVLLLFDEAKERVARHSKVGTENSQNGRHRLFLANYCSDDLVNFENGFRDKAVVKYNLNEQAGICEAEIHLPYGYATQIKFEFRSEPASNDIEGKEILYEIF